MEGSAAEAASALLQHKDVKALYHIMQSMEGKLGGGEGIEGLYGSITRTGMQKVLDSLAKHCGLCNESHIVDVGAGLGRPLLHALVSPGVASGYGIEIDKIKCNKAAAFLQHSARELARRAAKKSVQVPKIKCSSIEKVPSLDPATHAYSFWEGVPVEAKCAFGELFAKSSTMQSVAVVQRAMRGQAPAEEMKEMGFGSVQLVDSFAVSMSGSGRSFTSYIFAKCPRELPTQSSMDMPATPPLHSQPRNMQGRMQDSKENSDLVNIESRLLVEACAVQGRQICGEASSPVTPGIEDRRLSSQVGTSPNLGTPKSSGVSGRPQRVSRVLPQDPSGLQARNRAQDAKPPQESTIDASKEGSRRSSRLQKQQPSAKLQGKLSPTKAKRTQKPKAKSPVKITLESAGFRSRRLPKSAAVKALNLPKPLLRAKGLDDSKQEIS